MKHGRLGRSSVGGYEGKYEVKPTGTLGDPPNGAATSKYDSFLHMTESHLSDNFS